MFLTRMYLNPTRLTTKRMLASPHVAHALVEGAIPVGSPQGRVLWRLDLDGSEVALLVVSPGRPDLTGVVEQAGWPTEAAWDTRAYDSFLARLARGQRWRFRLTANPVRSVPRGEGVRGSVSPHRTIGHQTAWLLSRAERLGVTFPESTLRHHDEPDFQVVVKRRQTPSFIRQSGVDPQARKDRVELTVVTYEGVLDVVDPVLLRAALTLGVGRAKGYGCGLMTLASL